MKFHLIAGNCSKLYNIEKLAKKLIPFAPVVRLALVFFTWLQENLGKSKNLTAPSLIKMVRLTSEGILAKNLASQKNQTGIWSMIE